MKIKRLYCDGYQNYENIDINFDDKCTYFIGKKSTGKTRIFKLIEKILNNFSKFDTKSSNYNKTNYKIELVMELSEEEQKLILNNMSFHFDKVEDELFFSEIINKNICKFNIKKNKLFFDKPFNKIKFYVEYIGNTTNRYIYLCSDEISQNIKFYFDNNSLGVLIIKIDDKEYNFNININKIINMNGNYNFYNFLKKILIFPDFFIDCFNDKQNETLKIVKIYLEDYEIIDNKYIKNREFIKNFRNLINNNEHSYKYDIYLEYNENNSHELNKFFDEINKCFNHCLNYINKDKNFDKLFRMFKRDEQNLKNYDCNKQNIIKYVTKIISYMKKIGSSQLIDYSIIGSYFNLKIITPGCYRKNLIYINGFDFDDLSSTETTTIMICSRLYKTNKMSLFMDEPTRGLSRENTLSLSKLLKENNDIQFIITTHNIEYITNIFKTTTNNKNETDMFNKKTKFIFFDICEDITIILDCIFPIIKYRNGKYVQNSLFESSMIDKIFYSHFSENNNIILFTEGPSEDRLITHLTHRGYGLNNVVNINLVGSGNILKLVNFIYHSINYEKILEYNKIIILTDFDEYPIDKKNGPWNEIKWNDKIKNKYCKINNKYKKINNQNMEIYVMFEKNLIKINDFVKKNYEEIKDKWTDIESFLGFNSEGAKLFKFSDNELNKISESEQAKKIINVLK